MMKNNKIKNFLIDNVVTIIFLAISIVGVAVANKPILFLVNEMVQRIARNTFLVMALIIPVLAGLGLNFSIIIGAMAGQMAIIMVTDFDIVGLPGILAAMVISVPLAWLFGWMIGKLLNKTRGQEMIASMIVGFFANGLYQFLYLFVVGKFIPMRKSNLLLRSGVGVRNTVDLENGLGYAFDNLIKVPFYQAIMIFAALLIGIQLWRYFKEKNSPLFDKRKFVVNVVIFGAILVVAALAHYTKIMPNQVRILKGIKVPFVTMLLIVGVAIFNILITKTKLGQDFRSVGQDQHIAAVSGINVDKTRVTAITISTILAAWGQIILLQNIGVLNTFGSHMQIGLFSVAALLVGGASVNKATVGQAFLGVILFHILFLISPYAGKELFGDAQIGEYFRSFVAYGVIGLSLGLYAWKRAKGLLR